MLLAVVELPQQITYLKGLAFGSLTSSKYGFKIIFFECFECFCVVGERFLHLKIFPFCRLLLLKVYSSKGTECVSDLDKGSKMIIYESLLTTFVVKHNFLQKLAQD